MVGFVLIVVLVVVGLMVFLIISLNDEGEDFDSVETTHMLNSIMKYTTECAITYEPDYDSVEDLFGSCYKNSECSNLGISACDYLNETLKTILVDLMKSEASISAYQLDFFVKEDDTSQGILRIIDGDCEGSVLSSQRTIVSGSDSLVIRMKVCKLL